MPGPSEIDLRPRYEMANPTCASVAAEPPPSLLSSAHAAFIVFGEAILWCIDADGVLLKWRRLPLDIDRKVRTHWPPWHLHPARAWQRRCSMPAMSCARSP